MVIKQSLCHKTIYKFLIESNTQKMYCVDFIIFFYNKLDYSNFPVLGILRNKKTAITKNSVRKTIANLGLPVI